MTISGVKSAENTNWILLIGMYIEGKFLPMFWLYAWRTIFPNEQQYFAPTKIQLLLFQTQVTIIRMSLIEFCVLQKYTLLTRVKNTKWNSETDLYV